MSLRIDPWGSIAAQCQIVRYQNKPLENMDIF